MNKKCDIVKTEEILQPKINFFVCHWKNRDKIKFIGINFFLKLDYT